MELYVRKFHGTSRISMINDPSCACDDSVPFCSEGYSYFLESFIGGYRKTRWMSALFDLMDMSLLGRVSSDDLEGHVGACMLYYHPSVSTATCVRSGCLAAALKLE